MQCLISEGPALCYQRAITQFDDHSTLDPKTQTPKHLDIGNISSRVQADLRVRPTSKFRGLGAGRIALVSSADLLHVGDLGGFDSNDICNPSALESRVVYIYISDNSPP